MKNLIDGVLENLSTMDFFLFRLQCGVCGKEYRNKPTRFSKAGVAPETKEKQILYRALYEQEFRDARHAAVLKAVEHVNYCPICKRIVCNQCFLICDDLDMCKECAAQLKETGIPVLTEVVEAVM